MDTTLSDLPIMQIRHLLWVADLGSFHAAGEKAFRSQSAITKSIQALELRLGAELLEPGKRTVLTPFGQACATHFRELLAHHDRAQATVSALVRKDAGSLTIAAIAAGVVTCTAGVILGPTTAHAAELGDRSLAAVLTSDGNRFDRNWYDYDIVTEAVLERLDR